MKKKDRNAVIGGLIFALFIAVCLAFIWDREADGDAYEPIDCPDGYVDCKGIPVTPTAEPEEPMVDIEFEGAWVICDENPRIEGTVTADETPVATYDELKKLGWKGSCEKV